MITILDADGPLNDGPRAVRGLDASLRARPSARTSRSRARCARSSRLHAQPVPLIACGTVVEPILSDQWFVGRGRCRGRDRRGRARRTRLIPERWAKAYFDWLRTSATGASRASCGGVTASRSGTATPARDVTVVEPRRAGGRALSPAPDRPAGRGRARHLVQLRAVAVLDARLAERTPELAASTRPTLLDHRLRHHLLLGRPHDDDGPPVHRRGAVSDGRIHGLVARREAARRCPRPRATSSTRSS